MPGWNRLTSESCLAGTAASATHVTAVVLSLVTFRQGLEPTAICIHVTGGKCGRPYCNALVRGQVVGAWAAALVVATAIA